MRRLLSCLLVLFSLAAQAKDADIADQAEQAVPQFHMAINGNNFDSIWQHADEALQKRIPQKTFVAKLADQKNKLGEVQAAKRTSWKLRKQGGDTLVTLRYKTTYAKGEAAEEFVVRLHGTAAQITNYRIKAKALK